MGRRKFLGSIASAGALTGIAGMSSASRRGSEAGGLLDVKDGRLEMNVQDDGGSVTALSADDIDGIDEARLEKVATQSLYGGSSVEIDGKEAAAILAKGVEKLNEAADAGEVEFGQQNGEVVVTPTAKTIDNLYRSPTRSGRRTVGSSRFGSDLSSWASSQISTCGHSGYSVSQPGWYTSKFHHELAFDNRATKAIIAGSTIASVAAGLGFAGTSATIVGIPLSWICGAAAIALGSVAALLSYWNEGCGVILHVKHLPIPEPPILSEYGTWNIGFEVWVETQ